MFRTLTIEFNNIKRKEIIMTVLLVLFTLIGFLIADYILQRRKQQRVGAAAIRSAEFLSPAELILDEGLALAPNHLWLRREKDNSITVGIDKFLLGLTGALDRIALPQEGEIVGRGDSKIVLRDRNKSLKLDSPVEGQVLKVNPEIMQSSSHRADVFTSNWLFKIIPSDDANPLTRFLSGEAATKWLRQQQELAREFLLAHTPRLEFATMHDGGLPADGVLKSFNADVWEEFEHQFLPSVTSEEERGEYDYA